LTTQIDSAGLAWNSAAIAGSAMLATAPSSTDMAMPMAIASIDQ
jgi:hypothetical protein